MAKNLPNGRRLMVELKIGGKTFYSKMKSSTAAALGLTGSSTLKTGAKGRPLRGHWRGDSYTLLLKQKETIGGAAVASVDVPIAGNVKLADVYTWAKKFGKVGGVVTPWGISYRWADTAEGGGGGGGVLPDLPGLDGGDLLGNAGGLLGGYLGGDLGSDIGSIAGTALGDYLGI